MCSPMSIGLYVVFRFLLLWYTILTKRILERKGVILFDLSQSIFEGSQARSWNGNQGGTLLTCLLPWFVYSSCFLSALRTTCSEVATPPVADPPTSVNQSVGNIATDCSSYSQMALELSLLPSKIKQNKK